MENVLFIAETMLSQALKFVKLQLLMVLRIIDAYQDVLLAKTVTLQIQAKFVIFVQMAESQIVKHVIPLETQIAFPVHLAKAAIQLYAANVLSSAVIIKSSDQRSAKFLL